MGCSERLLVEGAATSHVRPALSAIPARKAFFTTRRGHEGGNQCGNPNYNPRHECTSFRVSPRALVRRKCLTIGPPQCSATQAIRYRVAHHSYVVSSVCRQPGFSTGAHRSAVWPSACAGPRLREDRPVMGEPASNSGLVPPATCVVRYVVAFACPAGGLHCAVPPDQSRAAASSNLRMAPASARSIFEVRISVPGSVRYSSGHPGTQVNPVDPVAQGDRRLLSRMD